MGISFYSRCGGEVKYSLDEDGGNIFLRTVNPTSNLANPLLVGGTALQARKVASSCLDGVTVIFHWRNPSSRPVALGSTKPVTEMSTSNIFCGVKAVGA